MKELRLLADSKKAKAQEKYFQVRPGGYGEGDRFLGVSVPAIRKVLRFHPEFNLSQARDLIKSDWHEERMLALLILVRLSKEGEKVCNEYLRFRHYINNWDLVDISAHKILGPELLAGKRKRDLKNLASSERHWDRRIAIVSTWALIKEDRFDETLLLAKQNIDDDEDLMHKASGWMLREIGKRDEDVLLCFLDEHASSMPRVMLRYSLERLPDGVREHYMNLS